MFCYCGNEPKNRDDRNGNIYIEEGHVVCYGYISEVNCAYTLSAGQGLCYDSHGNIAEYVTLIGFDLPGVDIDGFVAGMGMFGVSFGETYTNVKAESIDDLVGIGSYVGGSVSLILSFGYDVITLGKTVADTIEDDVEPSGYQYNWGLGLGEQWVHVGNSYTYIKYIYKDGREIPKAEQQWIG